METADLNRTAGHWNGWFSSLLFNSPFLEGWTLAVSINSAVSSRTAGFTTFASNTREWIGQHPSYPRKVRGKWPQRAGQLKWTDAYKNTWNEREQIENSRKQKRKDDDILKQENHLTVITIR